MKHFSGSDHPTVYHGAGLQESAIGSGGDASPGDADWGPTREDVQALTGGLPRMFALIQEFGEDSGDSGEIVTEVVAYGLALPGGTAVTIGVTHQGFGRWMSAHSAASRLCSDLVWLEENGARPHPPDHRRGTAQG
jgi:hypothetical protein